MSARSKKSSAAIDRPFAPEIWERARELAEQYQIILVHEEGQWYGRGVELPRTFADGKTAAQCVANTREALATSVAYLLEQGKTPPAAASTGARSEQVNVRLSVEEKLAIEQAAKQRGYKGLSDFIRAAAVAAAVE